MKMTEEMKKQFDDFERYLVGKFRFECERLLNCGGISEEEIKEIGIKSIAYVAALNACEQIRPLYKPTLRVANNLKKF